MKKYVKVINENVSVLEFLGTDHEYAVDNGYTEQEVEQAYDGSWYLSGFAPEKPLNEIAQEIRFERDRLLTACDWTQMPDCPLNAETKAAWATYRQALRDIPEQSGFPQNVVFPEVPTEAINADN